MNATRHRALPGLHLVVLACSPITLIHCGGVANLESPTGQAGLDGGVESDADVDSLVGDALAEANSAEEADVGDSPTTCDSDCWRITAKSNLDDAIWFPAHTWIGAAVLIYGGFRKVDASEQYGHGGARYDPDSDTWSDTAPGPEWTCANNSVWTGSRLLDLAFTGSAYDPLADAWSTGTSEPPWRDERAKAVWLGDQAVVWGRQDGEGACGAAYEPDSDNWTSISPSDKGVCRRSALILAVGSRMLVWGGTTDGSIALRTGGVFDPETGTWQPTATQGSPSPRNNPLGVWTGTEVIVWGGNSVDPYQGLKDGAIYNSASNSWRPMKPFEGDTYWDGTVVWGDGRMFLWMGGGFHDAPGAIYNPDSDSWTYMSQINQPNTGEGAAVVWTGTDLFVWGGRGGEKHGWLYRPPPK
jgi:hypothetical protein